MTKYLQLMLNQLILIMIPIRAKLFMMENQVPDNLLLQLEQDGQQEDRCDKTNGRFGKSLKTRAVVRINEMQTTIDQLMIKHCPQEMTQQQMRNFEKTKEAAGE